MPKLRVLVVCLALVLAPGCRPTLTPTEQLRAAVISAHREAAPRMLELAELAERSAAQYTVAEPQREALSAAAAARRYAQLVEQNAWEERLIPLLREAVDAYIRLRELGLPLPALPDIVLELLMPCTCPT